MWWKHIIWWRRRRQRWRACASTILSLVELYSRSWEIKDGNSDEVRVMKWGWWKDNEVLMVSELDQLIGWFTEWQKRSLWSLVWLSPSLSRVLFGYRTFPCGVVLHIHTRWENFSPWCKSCIETLMQLFLPKWVVNVLELHSVDAVEPLQELGKFVFFFENINFKTEAL